MLLLNRVTHSCYSLFLIWAVRNIIADFYLIKRLPALSPVNIQLKLFFRKESGNTPLRIIIIIIREINLKSVCCKDQWSLMILILQTVGIQLRLLAALNRILA